ncbi:MAG: ATP-binding protein [Planctomycetota bacterium]
MNQPHQGSHQALVELSQHVLDHRRGRRNTGVFPAEPIPQERQAKRRSDIDQNLHDRVRPQMFVALMRLAELRTHVHPHREDREGYCSCPVCSGLRLVEENLREAGRGLDHCMHRDHAPTSLVDVTPEIVAVVARMNTPQRPVVLKMAGSCRPIDAAEARHLIDSANELICNSLRHGKAKSVQVHLIWPKASNGKLRLLVHDDGNGLSTDDVCFGLGLTGVARRADLHGGGFRFRSRPGRGMTCSLSLPLDDAAA